MELKAEDVKNIRSLAFCKELLRQAIEQNDQLKEERDWLAKDRAQAYNDLEKRAQLNIKQEESNRHSKYKRCLAMAMYCHNQREIYERDSYDWELEDDAKDTLRSKAKIMRKWRQRWLKIAKQFKEVASGNPERAD